MFSFKQGIKLRTCFITDNLASNGVVSQNPSGGPPANLANDGTLTTCSKTKGSSVTFHVDLQEKSIVTGLFILLGGQSLLILEHDKLLYT